jgi:cellulose synthase operon protein C
MKLGFRSIKSLFQSSSSKSTQSTEVTGDYNTVQQSITNIIVTDLDDEFKREILARAEPSLPSLGHRAFAPESLVGDDREEIKRILEYRQLANNGDSATAIALLTNLRADVRYATGYFAFRLNFNIGVLQQNIGELANASASLRAAYVYCPEDQKAQTGLAFAELLDREYEQALERASSLMDVEGDHRNLAACILFHTAKSLKKEIDVESLLDKEYASSDIVAAYLEYVRELRPDEYVDALNKAFVDDPDNEAVATMWALSILDDMRQNQAFLLGAKMSDGFEENVAKSAEILRGDLANSLDQRPPNKLLLPSQANNAAVALRLSGNVADAAWLVDKALNKFPELTRDLAQIRAVLLLQEEKDTEALELIRPLIEVCELQVMASELEAKLGDERSALARINAVLKLNMPEGLLIHALATKARIGINTLDQDAVDEALEDLVAIAPGAPVLVLLRSAYDRAFVIRTEKSEFEQLPVEKSDQSSEEKRLLASLIDSDDWDFLTLLQAADELLVRGYYRECTDLLRDRVSLSKESPALSSLCDACMRGHLGSLAKEINDGLAQEVKNSVFGWKFGANVAYLSGEVAKAVPLTRKLFEQNPRSIRALEWYVQSLQRTNDRKRIQRLIKEIDDWELSGTVQDRRGYVNLLVFCGEVERARSYAYRLFCENQNDHQAWMALSSSVLAFGRPPGTNDDLEVTSIQENSTFEVVKPDGDKQNFTIETSEKLFPLRDGNISLDHPVAQAALGKTQGDEFPWPFKTVGQARIASVKHKTLAAFHMVLARFEERFPEASGFKSISVNFEREDGLDEMRAMLKQRADYSQSKAKEYQEGSYPIYILGHHLGIDPIEALLGLKAECGISLKVSSCSHADQDKANLALKQARKSGLIADASACYLLRRLELEKTVKQEFGPIGVTQETIDIFARRLQDAESSSFFDSEKGTRRAGSVAVRDGQIVLSELTEDEVNKKIDLMRSDLEWLKSECELVPAVAKTDPDDAVIRFRREEGGRFFDDIFASDGSGRVLISDDFHLRQWAEGLFQTRSAWIQALLFHLEETGKLPIQTVVKSTIQLCHIGEDALSTNSERIMTAAEMLSSGELSEAEFTLFCSLLGQSGADIRSHVEVTVSAIRGLWEISSITPVREKSTGIILRSLTRFQRGDTRVVLDTVQTLLRDERIRRYIAGWRIGHFLT